MTSCGAGRTDVCWSARRWRRYRGRSRVGAGPAAFYAAEELVRHSSVQVDVYDRLPTPYGLVRAGVAPDHAKTKGVENTFASTERKKNFTYHLNVDVGTHITHDELTERYGAVLYAVGAAVIGGTSLSVYPAAYYAQLSRGAMVIINRDPTQLDGQADLVIRNPIGDTLKRVMEARKPA